jgi:hypothetical protein
VAVGKYELQSRDAELGDLLQTGLCIVLRLSTASS